MDATPLNLKPHFNLRDKLRSMQIYVTVAPMTGARSECLYGMIRNIRIMNKCVRCIHAHCGIPPPQY